LSKYSDLLAEWLVALGYTHCFFVAGGHVMHLLESCSRRFTCLPVVHEVAAGIAAEYFNEVHLGGKAFALVTSGPGLTNMMTAMAGAYLESRELLVIGGQVKLTDLSWGEVRQRGIQEIDGAILARPICKTSIRFDSTIERVEFNRMVRSGQEGRPGPVFLEIPLDVQAAQVIDDSSDFPATAGQHGLAGDRASLSRLRSMLAHAKRPVLLLGAGVSRDTASRLLPLLGMLGIPLMLTWNAMDRVPHDHPLYFGRPNTWGQRYANILLQQADLLVALGTRLSLQQTGFCWQQFLPAGDIVQVDCDARELTKGHPHTALGICADANAVLEDLCSFEPGEWPLWSRFCREVQIRLPVVEPVNQTANGYLSPYEFVERLSQLSGSDDIVIPCSSGSAFTVMMQTFRVKGGQRVVTNKGIASMGYGLSGAIGAAIAGRGRRTLLVEGDGGFLQNLQELGTVAANQLNLKIFIFDDQGYASIRMTQKNYFGGRYVGCDRSTGLGIPCWEKLFAAYGIPVKTCLPGFQDDAGFLGAFDGRGPAAFLVHIDPEQTYFPKISSRLTASGSMESSPLHLMSPALDHATAAFVFRHLPQAVTAP
jgi:acetolactate synthase-1/2/3 large subunit